MKKARREENKLRIGYYTCPACRWVFRREALKGVALDGELLPRFCPRCGVEMKGDAEND